MANKLENILQMIKNMEEKYVDKIGIEEDYNEDLDDCMSDLLDVKWALEEVE
jgi:hypothetical protein